MIFYVDKEIEYDFPFDPEQLALQVGEAVLKAENVPMDCEVNLVLTDDEGIRMCNAEFRDIDSVTDVLSFPSIVYDEPADFSCVALEKELYTNLDSGLIMLGDMMINCFRVEQQAREYNHSMKREFAFLIAHSMFHLLGYDHMTDEERIVMEDKQRQVLEAIKITRDIED